ncbi:MAG TPA: HD domain-containing phosphohydrolase [Anaerolineales bacterium]|nr:HD domain-containing phosphohydrolase [Anaerolineales bacterium]
MVKQPRLAAAQAATIALVAAWIGLTALGVFLVPGLSGEAREMIAFSQVVPILLAAAYFGQSGGLLAAFAASMVTGSLVVRNIDAVNTVFVQRVMFQITAFNATALLTSFLSDQVKLQRKQAARQLERITAVRAIDRAINAGTDLGATLYLLLESLINLLEAEAAVVYWRNPKSGALEMKASLGFFGDVTPTAANRPEGSGAEEAARDRRTVHIADLGAVDPSFSKLIQGRGVIAYYAVPLVAHGDLKGVLEIYDRASRPDENWRNDLEALAGQAAVAIEQSRLIEDLADRNAEMALAYDATLHGWSRALDLRDRDTEGHTQRVVATAVRLAERMGLAGDELVDFRRGAILHDIGKMGVPDDILHKPGPLTDDEWAVMRRHPLYAQTLLAPVRFLEQALVIPLYHHERWDGSGYPFGLCGGDIPLWARIFAVVDVWDALRSDRPYRRALPDEHCLRHLCEQAGSLYDPAVVESFIQLLEASRNGSAQTSAPQGHALPD